MRNILKLYILLLLFPMASCASVDQALYSVSEGISDVDRVTGQRTANITSRQNQIQRSNQVTASLLDSNYISQGKKIDAALDPKGYARLKRVFDKVHAVSHMRHERWQVHLIPEDTFNAFVTGGSSVVVHKGLLDDVNDDELAAIIGHEIAHVSANHIYERNAHALAATLNNSKSIERGTFSAAFTHESEEEADEVGILYATLAGYDPNAAANLWQRMYKKEGDFSAIVVDHPINSERYRKAAELADAYKQYYTPKRQHPDFPDVLMNNSVFGPGPEDMSRPAPGEGGGFLAALEAVASGMETHYAAKAEEARQSLRAQRVEWVQQNMGVTKLKLQDPNRVLVGAKYTGAQSITNTNFMGVIGNQRATKRIEYPIHPNDYFEFELVFPSNVSADYRSLRFVVTHADGFTL